MLYDSPLGRSWELVEDELFQCVSLPSIPIGSIWEPVNGATPLHAPISAVIAELED